MEKIKMDITETTQLGNSTALTGLDAGWDASVSKSQQDSQGKLVDVAKKFEGMLVHEMFKQVHQGLEAMKEEESNEEESDSDTCGEQYQSLYWSQLADVVGEQGGIGFWKTIYNQVREQVNKTEIPGGLLDEGV
jgi:Rod binding domain-containing protein